MINPTGKNYNNSSLAMGHIHPEIKNSLDGLDGMAMRLKSQGGFPQQKRMIEDKKRSLDRAILYSYQGAFVQKVGENRKPVRALINPNKLKQDYDDKILSADNVYGFQPGDVFEWKDTKTYWLIYLQDLTELAYFRGDIRKCQYTIDWIDEEGNRQSTYAAIRGPVETKIDFIQKYTTSIDRPNHSLDILMPKNAATLAYFDRYTKFYLQEDSKKICWRVEGIDWVSMPGVLEVQATEYYANKDEDDISGGIAGALKLNNIKETDVRDEENLIFGPLLIKPNMTYDYEYKGALIGEWKVESTMPIDIIRFKDSPKIIRIEWTSSYSGEFVLRYGEYSKKITVESLF